MPIKFKNIWGATDGGVDQQRADLFQVHIDLPSVLGSVGRWGDSVEFALTRFPFPERKVEMIAVKRMQQTNHVIGPDQATGPIEIPCALRFQPRHCSGLGEMVPAHFESSHRCVFADVQGQGRRRVLASRAESERGQLGWSSPI